MNSGHGHYKIHYDPFGTGTACETQNYDCPGMICYNGQCVPMEPMTVEYSEHLIDKLISEIISKIKR